MNLQSYYTNKYLEEKNKSKIWVGKDVTPKSLINFLINFARIIHLETLWMQHSIFMINSNIMINEIIRSKNGKFIYDNTIRIFWYRNYSSNLF